MTPASPATPGFWRTVRILMRVSRSRAGGRRVRQRELLSQRSRGGARDFNPLAAAIFALFLAIVNGAAGYCVVVAVKSGQRGDATVEGHVVVGDPFYRRVLEAERDPSRPLRPHDFEQEARRTAREQGGSSDIIRAQLESLVTARRHEPLVADSHAVRGLAAVGRHGLAAMLGSLVLFLWFVMLAFQGEGIDLDTTRRRFPMWEWLFSHPVPASAVFFAEMLSPLAANPLYWSAPLFTAVVYGQAYGVSGGIQAAVLAGIPIAVAASCVGKAIEVAVLLRISVRSRGAVIGLMSWAGYASLMVFFVGVYLLPTIVRAGGRWLHPVGFLLDHCSQVAESSCRR